MRRRLTWAIVGTVAATLVLAGLGTLLLARVDARRATRDDLADRASELAATIAELPSDRGVPALHRLRGSLGLDDLVIARFGPAGNTPDPLPTGVDAGDLHVDALRAGDVVADADGDVAFAAAAVTERATANVLPVVVVTAPVGTEVGAAGRWFLAAAALTLVVGAVVASRLGRRVAGPLADVDGAARRIAAGDLSARAAEVPGDDEVARLVRSINAMAAELERSRDLERRFLLSVSHDLRTPLTSIRGWAEAIADGAAADPAGAAGIVLTEAGRLERLVRDLLDLARLQSRRFALDAEAVDLAEVAAGTADGLRPELEDAGVVAVVDAPTPVVVLGDPDRVAQVAANLLENAGRYARSRVWVTVAADGQHGVLRVVDDGPGIGAADLPHVFDLHYGDTGSGLGLAIVRELVHAMGGTVAAEQDPGGGARLLVRLPLAG